MGLHFALGRRELGGEVSLPEAILLGLRGDRGDRFSGDAEAARRAGRDQQQADRDQARDAGPCATVERKLGTVGLLDASVHLPLLRFPVRSPRSTWGQSRRTPPARLGSITSAACDVFTSPPGGAAGLPLPGGRQRLPERDQAVLDLEVAAGGQVLEETADHLAGRTDAV